jgi:hypothetical protein
MIKKHFLPVTIAALVLAAHQAAAQISITSGPGLTYSQNFDSLTRSGTAEPWGNNADAVSAFDAPRLVGLLGWYTASYTNGTDLSAVYTPQILASAGGAAGGNFYSYGLNSSATDRAFGTLPQDAINGPGTGSLRIGARFVNNTGGIIDSFTFAYDGEQWRIGAVNNVNNQYVVSYATFAAGAGTLDSTPYVATSASATFNTPFDGTGASATLDGNQAANRVAGLGDTITGLAVLPGEEIWIRWFDSNSSGADHGIAIDNFSVAFTTIPVPEPSTAMILGLGLMLLINRARKA